jgi:hypothetical protein
MIPAATTAGTPHRDHLPLGNVRTKENQTSLCHTVGEGDGGGGTGGMTSSCSVVWETCRDVRKVHGRRSPPH